MKKTTLLAAVAMVAVSGGAIATPTLVGTQSAASGIDGVVVGSVTYDVSFSLTSFDETFTDVGDAGLVALAADLNALGVTGLLGVSGFPSADPDAFSCTADISFFCYLWVGPSTTHSAAVHSLVGAGIDTRFDWEALAGLGGVPGLGCARLDVTFGAGGIPHIEPNATCSEAAHWSARGEQVPEPATLSLLGLGLAAVGLARRRKKQSATV